MTSGRSRHLLALVTLPMLGMFSWATAQAGGQDKPTTETSAG